MFEGLELRRIETPRGALNARVGGSGPGLLLLHGYPENHLMWRDVAPALSERFKVVVPDLPGYGESFKPAPTADHEPHSKRAMGRDMVAAMSALGFERFSVAGHDRGGRVAYRMTLDHPDRVDRLAVLDIVPTAEVWERLDRTSASVYWHWTFLAQTPPLPEQMIAAAADAYLERFIGSLSLGAHNAERYPAEVMASYRAMFDDPPTLQAMCEDYRAGATIDVEIDQADRGPIGCPVLVLWGTRGALERFYGDVLEIWRPWAPDLRGRAVQASHFLIEDEPEQTVQELLGFFGPA
jgi:haloacetate dehalogenase